MADETNWLNFPNGDHWLDTSLERQFYPDLDEIDDMIDEGRIDLAQRVLKNFPKPKERKQLAEWHYVNARIQTKKRNYALALKHSKKAIHLKPKNSRYRVVRDDIHALMLFEKVKQDYEAAPAKESFFYGLQQKIGRFVENLCQSAFLKLYLFYSRFSHPKTEEEPSFTVTNSVTKNYKFECNLENKLIDHHSDILYQKIN